MRDMPEEIMSDLDTALRAERAALEEELSEHGKKTGVDTWDGSSAPEGGESDPADAADQIEELVANVPLVKELETRYREVKGALKKIKAGTYGTCEECGIDIPLERLEANAAARTCIAHTK